jgi:hypothetical protein
MNPTSDSVDALQHCYGAQLVVKKSQQEYNANPFIPKFAPTNRMKKARK